MATNKPQPAPQQQGSRQRILRIGILLGGKIVEERLIRERTPVTIGQSMKNTFSIPVEGLPLEFTLFALDEHRYSLRFLNKMDGRLSDSGGQVNTLDGLKTKGAQNHGDYWQVPLTDSARGKLSLGDLTVLFQFVTEPPRQPKPMLPASVRGTFADRFDPQLSVIMGASIIAHFAIVIIALIGDVEQGGMAERAYNVTFKQDTYQIEQPEEKVADAGSGSGSAEKAPEKKAEKPTPKPSGSANTGRSQNDKPTMTEDEAARYADLLTGEGDKGKSEGDMAKRRPGADLGTQISDVRSGAANPQIGGNRGGSRGGGDPRVGTTGGIKVDAGGLDSAGGGKTAEKGPQGRISVSSKSGGDESSLTADAVLRKIQQAYMSAIKHCYTTYLKKEATARGGVSLSLTVNKSGRTTEGNAAGFPADEVNGCITGLMGGWTFPPPKDKDNEATEASFRIKLQLVPD